MTPASPKLLAALLCGGLAASGAALAQPRDGQGRPPLPPESFTACQGRAEGAAVTITLPDGKTLSATCRAVPPMPLGDARAAIRRYNAWTPWQVDAATLETAWAVEARHQLAWGDCLSVAAAQHSGCASLLSLSLPHGGLFGGVEVLHPQRCVFTEPA